MIKNPLDTLLNWYEGIPTDKQRALALVILLYLPDYTEPIQRNNIAGVIAYLKGYLNNSKNREKVKIIGTVMSVRSIINYYFKGDNLPIDEKILKDVSLNTAVIERMKNNWDDESIEKLRNILNVNPQEYIKWNEIKNNWQTVCDSDLSDKSLGDWLLSNYPRST